MTRSRPAAPTILGALFASAAILALSACGKPASEKAQAQKPAAPAAYNVYVTNEDSGDLTIIDGTTGQVAATVPLGKRPRGVRVSADGRTLYIALSGSPRGGPGVDEKSLPPPDKSADGIGVFDVASRKLVTVLHGVSDPEQLAVGPDHKLYVASEDTGTAVVLDAASGKVIASVPTGQEPEGVSAAPDGKSVYVTSEGQSEVTVIDTATDKAVATIKVGQRPRTVAFTADGARAYVPGEADRTVTSVDARNHTKLQTVTLPDEKMLPMTALVSADGRKLFVSTGRGGEVAALEIPAMNIVGKVKVGDRPWGMALSPDGKLAYTANGPSNDVSVVDTDKLAVVATIKAGGRPWGVAVGPAVQAK